MEFQSAPKLSSGRSRNCDHAMQPSAARWDMPRLFALNFRSGLLIGFAVAIAVAAAAIAYERYDTQTLKRTLRRDAVLCGVNTGLPGFSSADEKGNWSGFDVAFCPALPPPIFYLTHNS